jgi:hypothetical protein
MAKTVFVLGAGSSKVTGCPLMLDFIDSADDLRTEQPVSKKEFDLVFDLIQAKLPRLHAKTSVDLRNIESVFSLVEMGRLGERPRTERQGTTRASAPRIA